MINESAAWVDNWGTLTNESSGWVDNWGTLTGESGSTQTNNGTLSNESGAALSGDIVDNALMQFLGDADASYGGAISGTGSVDKSGAGVLTLTGTNTFTGDLDVQGGYVAVSQAGNLGGGSIGPDF